MLTNIYYSLAIFAYSIFLVQFIVSLFGGDTDVDIDFDGDGLGDLSWGDIFSFKGFIHFLMGCAGWLSLKSLNGTLMWFDYPFAIFLGFIFVHLIYFVGRLLLKLKHEPTGINEEEFEGKTGIITIKGNDNTYYVTIPEFGGTEIKTFSSESHSIGEEVKIKLGLDKKYYI